MSLTIRSLAKALHTTPGTVSKALSHEKGVSAERAAEICRYAEAHGYRPAPMRRRLTRTIGLIDCSFHGQEMVEDTYRSRLISAILTRVSQIGQHTRVEILKRPDDVPGLIQERFCDGLFLFGNPSEKICDLIRKKKIPSIVLDDQVRRTGLPSVMADISSGTRDVVEQLTAMGHERIALVSTVARNVPSLDARIRGYTEGLSGAQEPMIRYAGNASVCQGQIVTQQLMSAQKKPTAIVYVTDILAIGGIIALVKMGINVPRDVSVVGHNNTYLAQKMDPELTSVDLHLPEMVETGLNVLTAQIRSGALEPESRQYCIPVTVYWRNSSGSAPQDEG